MQKYKSDGVERRQHRRVIFTINENINGQFLIPGIGKKPISSYILNMSMGGLHFTPKKGKNNEVKKGDRLVFMHLNIPHSDPLILNIDAEIKWVINPDMLEYIGIGCSFTNLSDSSRKRLKSFIKTRLNQKNI
jgi:c-di-GMP-binding flagellar brake protein YcgR